jgi:hypothetical protein
MLKANYLSAVSRIMAGVMMFFLLVITSCKEDEPAPKPTILDFAETAKAINENGGPQTITIQFSKEASRDGEIELTVTPANAAEFINIPTSVIVTEGTSFAQITVTPINNATIDGARQATITLSNPSKGFQLGTQSSIVVTVADDEGEVTANFATNTGEVSEASTEGINVNILLSDAADVAGTIVVTFPNDKVGLFTSNPALSGNSITIPVAASATSASFTIIPVNNSEDNENPEIEFTMSNATGGVLVGTNTTYTLTITDDDDIVQINIADVRAQYAGSNITIANRAYIQGVVVSSSTNYTNRNLFIQDGTGAIAVRFVSSHSFAQGDEIKVLIEGGLLTRDAGSGNTGPLQIGGSSGLANATASKVGDGVVPAHQIITIDQLNSGDFEGKLVRVEGVGFFDANGTNNLRYNAGNGSGNNKFGDVNGNTSLLRVEFYAPFSSDVIPLGTGNLQGIATVFNTDKQIIPQSATDIFTSNEVATMNLSTSSLDFGNVANGANATLTYTVSGTSLIGDVNISGADHYTVSLDGITFTESVTVSAATANAGPTTIHVRFAPASGVDQTLAGNLEHKSLSASVKKVSTTGNETGNGGSTLLLNEQFDYGVSPGELLTVSSGNWLITGSSITNPIQYVTSSLSMTNYPSNGVGGGATLTTTGQDVRRQFSSPAISSGVVYSSTLVSISSAQTNGDYFLHFSDGGTSNFYCRVYAKDDGGVLRFGFFPASGTPVYSTNTYAYNTTYIVVLRYDFSTATASLFVLSSVSGTEPGTPTLSGVAGTPSAGLSHMGLRQGTASNAPALSVDGIRVALNWADLFN